MNDVPYNFLHPFTCITSSLLFCHIDNYPYTSTERVKATLKPVYKLRESDEIDHFVSILTGGAPQMSSSDPYKWVIV